MAKLTWAAYEPSQINWRARERAELLTIEPDRSHIDQPKKVKVFHSILFCLGMVGLFLFTVWRFM